MRSGHRDAVGRWRSVRPADVCLSVVVLAAAELEVLLDGLGPDAGALAVIATLPLALRRLRPVAAFGCTAVLAPTLDRWLGVPWGGEANAPVFLVLLASYSLGAHASPRRSLLAVCAGLTWLSAVEAVWGDGADYAFMVFLFGVPCVSGVGVRRYRGRAERLRELAARLREERAVSARVAVVRERQRMARESDDAIGHAVAVMGLQAAGAEQVLQHDPERARRALVTVQETGREAVRGLREVLGILRCDDEPVASPAGDATAPAPPAAPPRTRLWPERLNAALALVVVAAGVVYAGTAASTAGVRAAAGLVQVVAAAAVLLRERRPYSALGLGLVAYVSEARVVGGNPGSPAAVGAVLLVTYSAAAACDRGGAVWVAVAALGVPALIALGVGGDAADVLLPVTIIAIPWFAGRAIAAYRRQGEALAILTSDLMRERDARARLAVLEERARVGRELHDSVGHAISVMVLQAGAAEHVLDRDPDRARQAMRAVQDMARDALDDLRALLGLLGPTEGRPPLVSHLGLAQLDRLVAAVRQTGLQVQLRVIGDRQELSAAVDAAAYRIVQEALTNALKHSGAAPTTVTVRYAADGVHLNVVDEGRRPIEPHAAGGSGLTGMRERVIRHGGRLHAGCAPGGAGFAVSAFLPLTAAEHEPERVRA